MRHLIKTWTTVEEARARDIFAYQKALLQNSERWICALIAQKIGRTPKAVRSRLQLCGPNFHFIGKRSLGRPRNKPRTPRMPSPHGHAVTRFERV